MNINLIKADSNISSVKFKGSNLLETSHSEFFGRVLDIYRLFDPKAGVCKEIAPEIRKYSFIPVINCIWQSAEIYFATYEDIDENLIKISVYLYVQDTNEVKTVYTFEEDPLVKGDQKQIKIFVFNSGQLIIQTEHQKKAESASLMGNIEFSQTLVNTETGAAIVISDQNLINNGINRIIPVSATHMMLKTGYSHPEDERFEGMTEDEALIEGVYFGVTSAFLSSASLGTMTEGFELLSTAYFDKSILKPSVFGDYIFFTIVNKTDMTSESIFFNYKTGKRITCQDLNVTYNDLYKSYVIGNIPYFRRTSPGKVEFVNLLTSEIDCIFYDEDFAGIFGNILLFSKKRFGRSRLRAYRLPKLDLILDEAGRYVTGCETKDECYIYIKNG